MFVFQPVSVHWYTGNTSPEALLMAHPIFKRIPFIQVNLQVLHDLYTQPLKHIETVPKLQLNPKLIK